MGKGGVRCCLCNSRFTMGEVYYSCNGRHICEDCVDGITAEDLIYVTGAQTARTMLMALGFEKNVI